MVFDKGVIMHDKELVGYIEKELQKGFHHNEIRRALLAVGHDAQVVEDSLLHVHNNLERKMKVKKALSILIPILLVLLIIVAVYVMKQPSSTDNPPISDNITKQQNNGKIENEKIENPAADDNNYNQAMMTGDYTYCNKIINEAKKTDCISIVGGGNNAQSTPEVLSEDEKTYQQAMMTGDPSYCSLIKNEAMKADCISIVGMPSAQETNNNPGTDNSTVAENTESGGQTSELPPDAESSSDQENYNQAMMTGDSSYCDQIINEAKKADCHSIVG